jgi:Na+/melibiose symporter-like transporter
MYLFFGFFLKTANRAIFAATFFTMKLIPADICCEERRTFRLHLAYSIIEGFILAVLALNEFVFIKSLLGSNYQLGMLFQFSMLVFLLLLFVNEFLKRIKKRRVFLRRIGIITRLPLMLLLFFPRSPEALQGDSVYHLIFLAIFLVYFLAAPVINPTINLLLRTNYKRQNFGRLYSMATSANKIVLLIVTFLYGLLLDFDNYAFVYVFPVASALGMISIFLLTKINYTPPEAIAAKESFGRSVKKSIKNMYLILKENRPYLHFEVSFMFYGIAFMLSYPVLNIFFHTALELNYSSVAFYRNSYNVLAIALLPLFGRLLGKMDPRKFGVITFGSLAVYLFFLMITEYFPFFTEFAGIKLYYTLILYVVFHGFFAATMVLLWNIGSAYFGEANEADIYQSIHLFLTGVRALFAPLFGVWVYEKFGFSFTFLLAISLVIVGVLILVWSYSVTRSET